MDSFDWSAVGIVTELHLMSLGNFFTSRQFISLGEIFGYDDQRWLKGCRVAFRRVQFGASRHSWSIKPLKCTGCAHGLACGWTKVGG